MYALFSVIIAIIFNSYHYATSATSLLFEWERSAVVVDLDLLFWIGCTDARFLVVVGPDI